MIFDVIAFEPTDVESPLDFINPSAVTPSIVAIVDLLSILTPVIKIFSVDSMACSILQKK